MTTLQRPRKTGLAASAQAVSGQLDRAVTRDERQRRRQGLGPAKARAPIGAALGVSEQAAREEA